MKRVIAVTAVLLVPLSAAVAQQLPVDPTANTLVRSSKGLLDWSKEGYAIAAASGDFVILQSGRKGEIVMCQVRSSASVALFGTGSKQSGQPADVLDASKCYEPVSKK